MTTGNIEESLSVYHTDFYYERYTFILDEESYVEMVILSSMKSGFDENNRRITRYVPLSSYSEAFAITSLTSRKKKEQLMTEKSIEEHYFVSKDEYEMLSHLEGNELFLINPTTFKSYDNY